MDLLARFRRKDIAKVEKPAAPAMPDCPHTALVPRWDSAADMGHEERASSYRCDTCGKSFSPAEARELRRTEAARIEKA